MLFACVLRLAGTTEVMAEVLFRDMIDIQPPVGAYERRKTENIYTHLEPAQFVACPEDIWQPLHQGQEEGGAADVKVRAPASTPARA